MKNFFVKKVFRATPDLVDKLNDCDMEEAAPSADDIFAYEFFKKADLLRNARIYSGNGTDGKLPKDLKIL